MDFNPAIIRAYDVRGQVGSQVNNDFAYGLGKAYGTVIRRSGGQKVSVGWDTRFTSPNLAKSFTQGVISSGCNVVSLGLVTTPISYFSVVSLKLDGGAMITGSHNTAGVNGFKLCSRDADPICGEPLQQLAGILKANDFEEGAGVLEDNIILLEAYKEDLLARVSISRPVKIVLDCGNGATSNIAIDVFKRIGCEVTSLFCDIRGGFWQHNPDPEVPENLKDLAENVRKYKAEFGIAFDSDGDRIGIVDEKGIFYESDKVLLLLAKDILSRYPNHRVLYDVKGSYIVDEEVKKYGGIPVLFRTGRSDFRRAMKENPNIILGGELSGHFFIADNHFGYDDGIFAALRLVSVISNSSKTFSSHFADVPRTFHTQELMPSCSDERKFEVVGEVAEFFRKEYQTIEIDGVRILFDDSSWALIRAKNTTPALSLRFEAKTKNRLQEIIDIVYQKLKSYNDVETDWYQQAQDKINERYSNHF